MRISLRSYRFELMVLLLAAVLRVGGIAVYGDVERPQLYEYGGIARHILAGQGYAHVFPILHPDYGIAPRVWDDAFPTAFTMPGYVVVMTAVLGTFGDNTTAYLTLYGLNVLVALLSLLELYLLTVILFSLRTARIALLLAAIFPPLVASAATFGGAVWTHAVMMGALWLVLRIGAGRSGEGRARLRSTSWSFGAAGDGKGRGERGKGMWAVVLAGLVAGIWVLFRGEALGAVVLIALWLWKKKDGSFRNAGWYFVACLLVVLTWSLRNTLVFDRVVPLTTNFWLNAWRGNNPATTGGAFKSEGGSNWLTLEIEREIRLLPPSHDYELRVMDIYRERTLDFITEQPGHALSLFLRKTAMFLTIDWSDPRARHPLFLWPQLALMAFTLAGAWLLARQRRL
ncbi:MAG: hypothetical protein KFF77_07655, partial [Bacteroidetes bacterium]|nr:hypothetical protein [Bacteroidota bacterium]